MKVTECYFCIMMKKMQILLTAIFLFCAALPFSASAQINIDTNDLILAGKYYQDGDFAKAADLYLKVYETSLQPTYFTIFLNCMVELKDFERAEKEIKQNMRGSQQRAELYVQYGYILKIQGRDEEADKSFKKAMAEVGRNKFSYNSLANEFLTRGEYEYAEKLYVQGQSEMPDEDFHYELARIFMYERNYERMLDEYLLVLNIDENNLINVQNSILSALSLDVDGSLNDLFRKKLLQQIQSEPQKLVFNRLLIWFFIQEKRFANALRQQIALDKRTGAEDEFILGLADIAGRNKEYDEALKAYDYLLTKGNQTSTYPRAVKDRMDLYYRRFIDFGKSDRVEAENLHQLFTDCFSILGYTAESYKILINEAHLLAFYMDETEKALEILNKGLKIQGLNALQYSEIKTEIADVQVYKGDEWDAVLEYSQVIEGNKTNALGDEAKLKKARLSYFLGDFKWAQAQLDVIKASTEKMTSNDAFELSMLIGNNLNLDTTDVPMQMFARGDLYLFRNQDSLAMLVFDSIAAKFPMHSLRDDIQYRKAMIFEKKGNYIQAAENLEVIVDNSAYELLADDALFALAEIYQFHLNRKEEARDLYKQMLVKYPGSVYVSESRNRFRTLRGDAVDKESEFLNGSKN